MKADGTRRARSVHGAVVVGVLVAAACLPGCDRDDVAPGEAFVVSDSAGVEIARNVAVEEALPRIDLSAGALVRLGSEDEGSPELFGRVNQVRVDPEGRLWVADGLNAELRVFALPSGEHLFTVGGPGDGPGEFALPTLLGFDGEGRAWIWDQRPGRLTILSGAGEVVEVRRVGRDRELTPRLLHLARGGSVWAQLPQAWTGEVRDGLVLHDTIRIWLYESLDTEPELVAERPGVTWYLAEMSQIAVPFAEGSRFELRDERVVFTDPEGAPLLDVVEDGDLVRRIQVERERQRVTAGRVEAALDGPGWTPQMAEILRDRRGDLPTPDLVPTWGWLRLTPDGHIFALRHGTLLQGEVWDAFDPAGRLRGVLTLPDEAHLMEVTDELLVVVEMPELAGPSVAVHSFDGW